MKQHIIKSETKFGMLRQIVQYLKEYHPAGYGTHVVRVGLSEEGEWKAVMSRSISCD